MGETEKTDFLYRRKPALLSFLFIYAICIAASYLMIKNSPAISRFITGDLLTKIKVPASNPLWKLPYGALFSFPFLLYGIRQVLWNIMSLYEFTATEIRLMTGSITRKEEFYPISEFFQISFRQNILEAPFGIGSITLTSMKTGRRLKIRGVYSVKLVVEKFRSHLGVLY